MNGTLPTPEDIKRVKGLGFLHDKTTADCFNARVITRNGRLQPDEIRAIVDAAEKFGSGEIAMTTRLTIEVQRIPFANIEPFCAFLAEHGLETGGTGPKVRPVVACKGTTCQYGLIDTVAFSRTIHERFYKGWHDVRLPHKFKIAVGGCPNNCVKPDLNDLGVIGQRVPSHDLSKCRGCKVCQIEKACPIGASRLGESRLDWNEEMCNHCGRCVGKCPFGVVGEEKRGFLIWGGQELHGTGKYLTVKHTYAQNLEEGDTISSIMTDAEECGEKVIAMYPSVEQLYEVDGNADYYVAFADSSAQNGTSSRAVDFQAAIMNNLGMSVEGVEYDAETGLIYIPKSLYGYDDIAAQGLQVQLLEPSSLEEGKAASVEVSVDNRNGSVTVPEKVQSVEADAFDTTISVRIATEATASAISIDDIDATADDGNVNYAKQTDGLAKSASYDQSTGVLTVAASPAATASLQVTIKGSGIGSLLAPQKAYAAYDTPDTMATLPGVQFDNMDPDSLSVGEKFWYSANTMYYGEAGFNTDLRGYMCIPYQQSYGGGALDWHNNDTANWMAGGNVYGNEDLYYHFTGESYGGGYNDIDTCVLQVAMIDGTVTGDQGHSVDFSHSGSLWSSHGWNEQLSLYCAHIDVTGGGNGAPGTRPTFARVLAKGDDYVVLAFLTSEVYTQTGFSAYKFNVQSKGDLEVQKS